MDSDPVRGPGLRGLGAQSRRQDGCREAHADNNRIERLNGTLRERVKVQRGWKSMKTPLAEGARIHFNFVRPHAALEGQTPAQAAGLAPKGWKELLTEAIERDSTA